MSESNAGGDDTTQLVGTSLSSYAKRETGTDDCCFGGGVAVQPENHDGVRSWIFFTDRTGDLLRSPVLL